MAKKVVIGLSGGVDSSVAAHLLIEQGYEVIAIFMRNWVDDDVIISEECPWIEDSNDALLVADKLGIPFHVIDFSTEYKERIVNYMFDEYERGRTPNPDILCNREVKFDLFLKKALALGADYVATGHYCQKTSSLAENGEEIFHLKAGADNNKDQSYFLCQVSQDQLAKALFPIGHLQKSAVREIAQEQGLITADKKDSQGLCFIGKVRLPEFLQQQLKPKEGNVIEIASDNSLFQRNWEDDSLENLALDYSLSETDGKKVGTHQGAHYFTIGQRKGLHIGGTPLPLFVIGTNTKTNIIYVGQGDTHPGLYRKALKVTLDDIHWLQESKRLKTGEKANYTARIRYRQDLEACSLYQKEDALYIEFNETQRGVAAGQFVAWYVDDELIGSGVIG